MRLKTVLLAALLAPGLCRAQTADSFQPAPTNVPNAEYPRIDAESPIEVRLKAPDGSPPLCKPRRLSPSPLKLTCSMTSSR